MPKTYTDEYFKNQTEKALIKSAIVASIPPNVTYYNLVMAFAELIQEWSKLAFEDEVMHYDPNNHNIS